MTIQAKARESRIGRKPVTIPAGAEVKIDQTSLSIKGPKGKRTLALHPFVKISMADNQIVIKSNTEEQKLITGKNLKLYDSISGTIRANIANTLKGVTQGFERKLVLVGVGYRAQSKGKVLALSVGYSHPTEYPVPVASDITIETPTQTEILIKGIDKELVGLVASQIRRIRPPEPYKGKGIRYDNERVEIKETKKK